MTMQPCRGSGARRCDVEISGGKWQHTIYLKTIFRTLIDRGQGARVAP